MKLMTKLTFVACLSTLLTGCGDRLSEIKDAASGINSAADAAASSVSRDVHAIRALTIN
ncbi:Lipoprotein OS=Lysinibacillus sphaericus OX=1421 GN=LS41612_08455 PE=4 SV=1 [Lysinibacillus sphaericus]